MTSYRIPNYLRASWQVCALDDGTSPRVLMPMPGGVDANVVPYAACWWQAVPARIDLEFLFRECRNPARALSDDDYAAAAAELGVDVPAIQAVAEVETSGEAFDESGRPRILFERHYFHRRTGGRHAATHPRISNARAGGYGKFSAQYGKLEEAYRRFLSEAEKAKAAKPAQPGSGKGLP